MTIYRYLPEYAQARNKVREQTTEDDLELIDLLFGRDNLKYGDDAAAVKAEALRQLEIEFRDGEDERATFYVEMAKAQKRLTEPQP